MTLLVTGRDSPPPLRKSGRVNLPVLPSRLRLRRGQVYAYATREEAIPTEESMSESTMNLLEIVHRCHNDNPWQDDTLIPFYLSPPPHGVQIGFLRDVVVKAIEEEVLRRDCKSFSLGRPATGSSKRPFVAISGDFKSYDERTSAMRLVVESWRERGLFPDPLNGA